MIFWHLTGDIRQKTEAAKILLYFTKEDLIFFCESQPAQQCVQTIVREVDPDDQMTSEMLLYRFFQRLMKGDMDYLDRFEEGVNEAEAEILSSNMDNQKETLEKIIAWRRELLPRSSATMSSSPPSSTSWRTTTTSCSPAPFANGS